MLKPGKDPSVKKTLVRDCEQKKKSLRIHVIRDTSETAFPSSSTSQDLLQKDYDLNHPKMCSSGVLANYIYNVKSSAPSLVSTDNLNPEDLSAKITKKLNFHFTDKMYKNLVELNVSMESQHVKKERRPPSSSTSTKRDLEPNLDDFISEDVTEPDFPPKVPVMRPKVKPVKTVERGQMHRLVSAFEIL